MDVAWQDGVGSFLDSSGTDPNTYAAFASDGSALWSSSADSPVFSGQSVLWESNPDTAGSQISGLTVHNAGGTDAGTLLAGNWIANGTWAFAGVNPLPDAGLLWAGAGSDTSNPSAYSLGLGTLDLGAGSLAYQAQQFVNSLASQSATGLGDSPPLLWTGAGGQPPITTPFADVPQAAPLASTDSFPLAPVGSLSPAQLVWTQPSAPAGAAAVGPSPYTPATGTGPVISVAPYTANQGTNAALGSRPVGFSQT